MPLFTALHVIIFLESSQTPYGVGAAPPHGWGVKALPHNVVSQTWELINRKIHRGFMYYQKKLLPINNIKCCGSKN